MKFKEINKKFTEKVAEYMAKGWYFNTATVSGSQGEVAKVDLTDGKRIVRIMLSRANGYGEFWWEGYKLTVGFTKPSIKPNDCDTWQTVWNNELEVVFEETFYRAGTDSRNDWFVGEEEARNGYKKMLSRYNNRVSKDKDIDLGENGAKIVLPFVKKQYRCGRAKACDVKVVKKFRDGEVRWYVTYKNHSWTLA